MLRFVLGISITLNIICGIIFFIIYKYGLKDLKKKIESFTLNNFLDNNFNIEEMYNDN